MAGGVAQAVEHLPSKCEALDSNPSTAKKKRKKSHKMYLESVLQTQLGKEKEVTRICVVEMMYRVEG
jgi:hypothetical protein